MTWEQWCDSKGALTAVRMFLPDLSRLARRQRHAALDGKLREAHA